MNLVEHGQIEISAVLNLIAYFVNSENDLVSKVR